MEQTPKVELGKQTRKEILEALKNIKMQISTARQRESSAPDVAADVLASGGGPFTAMKEALKFKTGQAKSSLKQKLDPLNIVNRMTGGSKLATVLAGKVMGRNEQSIRSAAGLQPMASPAPMMEAAPTSSPSPVSETSQRALSLFEQMAKGIAFLADRVNAIAVKMGATKDIGLTPEGRLRDKNTGRFVSGATARQEAAQVELLKQLVDFATKESTDREREKDASTEANYEQKFKKMSPTKVDSTNAPIKDKSSSGGWLDWVWGLLKGAATSFLGVLSGGLLAAGQKIGGLLLEGLVAAKTKIVDFLKMSWEGIKDVGGSIGKGASYLAGKAKEIGIGALEMAGLKKPAPVPTVPETPKPPITKTPVPITTKAPETATKVPKPDPKEAIKKVAPKLMGKVLSKAIPLVGFGTALYNLVQGDLTQAAIDAGLGVAALVPGVGTIGSVAAGLVGTLINDAYKEMYGIDPVSDPLRAQRLPELADAAKQYVKTEMLPKAEAVKDTKQLSPAVNPQTTVAGNMQTVPAKAAKPSEVALPSPTTGAALQAHADLKADTSGTRNAEPESGSANITNIRNNQVHSSMITHTMASPRSTESSFLRLVDRNYATP